jgi:hypothetical protein
MAIAGFIGCHTWVVLLVGTLSIMLVVLDRLDAALNRDDGVDIAPVLGRGDRPVSAGRG